MLIRLGCQNENKSCQDLRETSSKARMSSSAFVRLGYRGSSRIRLGYMIEMFRYEEGSVIKACSSNQSEQGSDYKTYKKARSVVQLERFRH